MESAIQFRGPEFPVTMELIKTARILIVDGDFGHARLLERILNDAGYLNLSTTMDPSLAVSMFNDDNPDLVLLDLPLPHEDGTEILQNLRRLVPADTFLPIIVLTADATPQTLRHAMAAGATDFLCKPLGEIEPPLRIENLLRLHFLDRELKNERALLEQRVRE